MCDYHNGKKEEVGVTQDNKAPTPPWRELECSKEDRDSRRMTSGEYALFTGSKPGEGSLVHHSSLGRHAGVSELNLS